MRRKNISQLMFTFTHYEDGVVLTATSTTGLYICLSVYEREECFAEDCKRMIDYYHGWRSLDINWQIIQGFDMPKKTEIALKIHASVMKAHYRKNLPF